MKYLKILLHLCIVIVLTLITQVGGLIWIAVFGYFKYRKSLWNKRKRLLSFSVIYLLCVFFIVPILAPLNNRRALPVFNDHIAPHNLGYVFLCRNYVHDDLYYFMDFHSESYYLGISGQKMIYLDAGFPFIDGFPLLPHLSHNDGRKIDIAFAYQTSKGESTASNPSLIGYGVFTEPLNKTVTQAQKCKDAGYWQYDYAKYLGYNKDEDLEIDGDVTKHMIIDLMDMLPPEKVFIEPHLIPRLELDQIKPYMKDILRYHGCHAVRHDDHIHIQISK